MRNWCNCISIGSDDETALDGLPSTYLELFWYNLCTISRAALLRLPFETEKRASKGCIAANQSSPNSFPAIAPESNGNNFWQTSSTCGVNTMATGSSATFSEFRLEVR